LSSFKPRLSILPPAQRALWQSLRGATNLGFVLYGGTAIALRLGHRESVDFDFFYEGPLNRENLAKAIPFIKDSTVLQDQSDALTLTVALHKDPVKVSFFGGIEFGHYFAPDTTDDGVLEVASLDDLMGTKLKTILQRAESKDYRDIAAMISAGVNVARGLAIAREMFGRTFQPAESLKALTYFKGGDLGALSEPEKRTLISAAASVGDLPKLAKRSDRLSARG
jgi:hypothetical protein